MAFCTLIVFWCKYRKASHFLVDFGSDREAKPEEERIHKSITKANRTGNDVA